MVPNDIKKLLEKYWLTESTLEEEARLKQYFESDQIDPSLMEDKQLFDYFKADQHLQLDDSFDENLLNEIIALKEPAKNFRLLPFISRIAAVGLFLFGAGFLYQQFEVEDTSTADLYEDTYEDPALAYEEAKTAILLLSKTLNKSKKTLDKGLSKIHKTTKIIKNQSSKIDLE